MELDGQTRVYMTWPPDYSHVWEQYPIVSPENEVKGAAANPIIEGWDAACANSVTSRVLENGRLDYDNARCFWGVTLRNTDHVPGNPFHLGYIQLGGVKDVSDGRFELERIGGSDQERDLVLKLEQRLGRTGLTILVF